jgi:hypothetical protein
MDNDIKKFTAAIGAGEPAADSKNYAVWKSVFRRSNYFIFNKQIMVVKISRSERPFWGLGKNYIDFLNTLDDYYVVLLISAREGWVFSKSEVNMHVRSNRWKLRIADNNYKMNFPLPDRNSFFSPRNLLDKLDLSTVNDAT